jgi:hypothetical protein
MLTKIVEQGLTLAVLSLALAGCGKEVGRVPFSGEGTGSVSVPLSAGDVSFWSDIDIKYEGGAALDYRIALVQGGVNVATAVCDPLGQMNIKVGWLETHFGSSSSRRGTGKMNCSASLPKAGPTTVQAALAFGSKPASFTLNKADLIIKQ